MALYDDVHKIVRNPTFQDLAPQQQMEVMISNLRGMRPDDMPEDFMSQRKVASEIIEAHTPGFMEKLGQTALSVGRFVPGVSEAIIIGEAATGTAEELRPISRFLAESLGVEESPIGRAMVEAGRIAAETAILFPIGGFLGRQLVGLTRFAPAAVRGAATAAVRSGDEALAAAATRAARLSPIVTEAAKLGMVGELFGVVDLIEMQELNPLGQFVLSPLLMAAIGAGIGAKFGRPPRFASPEEGQMVGQVLKHPTVQEVVEQGSKLADEIVKVNKVTREQAGDLVLRGLKEPLTDYEFALFRTATKSSPEILTTDFGLRLLQNQADHLKPKMLPGDGPLYVTVERAGRTETLVPVTRREINVLRREIEQSEVFPVRIEGKGAEVFAPVLPEVKALPQSLRVPTAAEVAGVPEAATAKLPPVVEGTPQPLSGRLPTAVEAGLERGGQEPLAPRQLSQIEQTVREQLNSPLTRELQSALDLVQGPLPVRPQQAALGTRLGPVGPEPAGFVEVSGRPNVPGFVISESRRPLPGPGAQVRLMETGEVGRVVRTDGPLVIVQTQAGEVATTPLANGSVRTGLPTRATKLGRPARAVADLTDDELVEGAALLGHRAQAVRGAAKNTVVERQGEFIAELERRFGYRIVPDGDGRVGRMLLDCL